MLAFEMLVALSDIEHRGIKQIRFGCTVLLKYAREYPRSHSSLQLHRSRYQQLRANHCQSKRTLGCQLGRHHRRQDQPSAGTLRHPRLRLTKLAHLERQMMRTRTFQTRASRWHATVLAVVDQVTRACPHVPPPPRLECRRRVLPPRFPSVC